MVCLARTRGLVGLPGQVADMAPWGCPYQGQDTLLSPDCAQGKQLRKHICCPSGEERGAPGCVWTRSLAGPDGSVPWGAGLCPLGGPAASLPSTTQTASRP